MIILCYISFAQQIKAQSQALFITDLYTGETVSLQSAKKVKLTTTDSVFFKGMLKVLNDSTLAIDSTCIPLDNITSLKIPKPGLTNLGNICVVSGSCLTSAGSSISVISLHQGSPQSLLMTMGICYAGIQSITIGIILRNIRKQYITEDYLFSIRKIDERW